MIIKTQLQGVDELRRHLAALRIRGNLKPLLADISEIIHSEVDENFQAGGRDPRWKESKRARKRGGQTLIDKGQLLGSIQTFVTSVSAGVATNKVYAAIHNFGGPITRKPHKKSLQTGQTGQTGLKANLASFSSAGSTWNMPQREFMKVSPAGISKIEQAAAKFVQS
jgi:phage gpG-like protein